MKFRLITGILSILVGIIFFGFTYDPLGTVGNIIIHVIGILFILKGINLLIHKEQPVNTKSE
ncbi:hypothetical protein CD30_12055 [Ureibacillus massiliensis 4400831 = CIP 108448 = CCUG 49529]|uniref:Serine kinase n=1 Tax=Ureibacillus massiliensis 4400831 = CIP 108448 = CCUG 49529 TaxID=1211035 RepID=A0A0A3IZY2_9BACL|nr:hypothetical protein [Ureibacillus massiliensis]KGR90299.1 hypothetical protein CD30_12055 [Ureibacillus massiliensis 4400831 = CIP 108448 = CCUG 49529]